MKRSAISGSSRRNANSLSVTRNPGAVIGTPAAQDLKHTCAPRAHTVSSTSVMSRESSEPESDFADHLPLQDVAEDVLLHFLVAEVGHLEAGDDAARRASARRTPPLTSVKASVVPAKRSVEHVLPVGLVGVADRQVAEEPRVAEVEAGVEAVLRRPVDVVDPRAGGSPRPPASDWYE